MRDGMALLREINDSVDHPRGSPYGKPASVAVKISGLVLSARCFLAGADNHRGCGAATPHPHGHSGGWGCAGRPSVGGREGGEPPGALLGGGGERLVR